MPYVPAGLPLSAYRNAFVGKAYENRPVSDPVTDVYNATVVRQYRSAAKTGFKGKKVKYPFGYWSPVREYTRAAVSITVRGNQEQWIAADNVSWKYKAIGMPWQFPSSPLAVFPFFRAGFVQNGVPLSLDTNTRNRLITECILKIGDRKMDIAESLAESREAITHLAKTFTKLLRVVLLLRRGNFRAAGRVLGISKRRFFSGKTAAERWTEYQYAWLPLLSDIYAASELARNGLPAKPPIISAVRNLSDSFPWECNLDPAAGKRQGTLVINNRCKLWYRLDDSVIFRLSQLGLVNPLEVAWAVIPFSFVVDWFLPIGNFLEAWSATLGLTYLDGVITVHAEGEADIQYAVCKRPSGRLISSDFVVHVSQKGINRHKVLTATPSLYIKSPFSSTHVVSALALLRQLKR